MITGLLVGEVVTRKPSGLALVAFPCGCQFWARRRATGDVRCGRQVAGCWGPAHDNDRGLLDFDTPLRPQ